MRWLATIPPLAFVACSYPEFAFTPTDTGVAIIDSESDSGVVEDSAPGVDTTVDTAVSEVVDTFVAADTADTADVRDSADTSTADTRDAADTAPPRACSLAHDFCADFDSVTTPSSGWTGSFSNGGGMLALDPSLSVSSSNSLRASVPVATVTANAMVTKSITITSSTTVIRVEARVRLAATTYTNPNAIIFFKVQRGSGGDGFGMIVQPTGIEVAAQTDTTWQSWPVTGITAGTWFRLRMDVVLHPTAGSVKVWVDDMTTPKVNQTGVASASADDLSRQLLVGLFGYLGTNAFTANFDDVSIDVP